MNNLSSVKYLLGSFFAALLISANVSLAAIDVYQFEDEKTEERFRILSDELRCPKCQNTNLSGSDAPLAKDLRQQIYTLLNEGQSDSEIVDYMVARYGDFVLYNPRLTSSTFALWFGPVILLLLGFAVLYGLVKRRQIVNVEKHDLTPEQRDRLTNLLKSE